MRYAIPLNENAHSVNLSFHNIEHVRKFCRIITAVQLRRGQLSSYTFSVASSFLQTSYTIIIIDPGVAETRSCQQAGLFIIIPNRRLTIIPNRPSNLVWISWVLIISAPLRCRSLWGRTHVLTSTRILSATALACQSDVRCNSHHVNCRIKGMDLIKTGGRDQGQATSSIYANALLMLLASTVASPGR